MLAASTIAAIYRDRWQIELFFKAIKQSLRIKTFIGTSENAMRIQIWTALISMLLLRYLHVRSTWRWSFSNMVAFLRRRISVYRDLWKLLDQPGQPPADLDEVQPGFAWRGWAANLLDSRRRSKRNGSGKEDPIPEPCRNVLDRSLNK